MSTGLRVGVLGVGSLAGYLVPRLARTANDRVLLSSRNEERAAQLAARFDNVEVSADNTALVNDSDIVLLTTRPDQAREAIEGLTWHPGHVLVSCCAGVTLSTLMFAAGAARLVRAMPVTAAVLGQSPTCMYPEQIEARTVLERLGDVHVLREEADFEIASVTAAYYGWVHVLITEMSRELAAAGLSPALARRLVAQITGAAAAMVIAREGEGLPALIEELCTPGGITALGLTTLEDRRALDAWKQASRVVLERLRES